MGTRRKKKEKVPAAVTYKIRLDSRTVITVSNIKMFEMWKQRYPKAELITQ
jgi:hypothetical protein